MSSRSQGKARLPEAGVNIARPRAQRLSRSGEGPDPLAAQPRRSALIEIPGPPRTKKNHGFRTKQGKQMPSLAFKAWNDQAQIALMLWRSRNPGVAFDRPVNCRAIFYRDAERGDAVGYYQALADALEEGRIVQDDVLIVSWDGSRLVKDADNPRIVLVLTEAE